MTNTEHRETATMNATTAPSAREIRAAVRNLSETQAEILIQVEREGRAERSSRPTRDALIRKGIVERSTTGALVLTALGEAVAAVLVPPPAPYADAEVTEDAELADVLGDDMPTEDAGFGYGLEPTEHETPEAIVAHLVDAGVSAAVEDRLGVLAYSASPETLACALDGTGWAASPLELAGLRPMPAMYVVERAFALPPVSEPTPCRSCGTVRGSGCAVCRPDSVLGG